MGLGRQAERQRDLLLSWDELPRSQGHPFYDKLQAVLRDAGFDRHVENLCQSHYSSKARGRKSLPPGRYFRMLLVGYFEGLDSERGVEWRCADSLSLREFLLLENRERVPDHSWLSRTRSRLPLEVHDQVFGWVLQRLAEHGLIKVDRVGVDASTMKGQQAFHPIYDVTQVSRPARGSQCRASCHCPPGYGRGLSRDAQTFGGRKRDRNANG